MVNNNIMAYLLSEDVARDKYTIKNDSNGSVSIQATLQSCNVLNRNGREYLLEDVRGGVSAPKIQELMARKQWFGEADHPDIAGLEKGAAMRRHMRVDAANRSHRIMSVDYKGNLVKGIVRTAPTVRGKEMRDLILDREGMEAAFSLRASGPVKQTSRGLLVGSPLTIVTYDWVVHPSHDDAYQDHILTENITTSGIATSSKGYCMPLTENNNDALKFAVEESSNYKLVASELGLDLSNMTLSNDNTTIIAEAVDPYAQSDGITTSKKKIVIGVEDFITKQFMDSFSNIGGR